MSSPFNFNLSQRAKLIVIVLSIFLISLSIGLLVFGSADLGDSALNAELLQHTSEEVMHMSH